MVQNGNGERIILLPCRQICIVMIGLFSACWCSDYAPPSSRQDSDEDCSKPCSGDASITCGAAWRAEVFKQATEGQWCIEQDAL